MAVKTSKASIQVEAPAPVVDLENAIADDLLDNIDWSKVRNLIIKKAPQKLFAWLTSGNNTPVIVSQFPELSALPSSNSEESAA